MANEHGSGEWTALREALTVKQVEDIHKIIERHSTDVIDYELATDDINALRSNYSMPSEVQEGLEGLDELIAELKEAGRCLRTTNALRGSQIDSIAQRLAVLGDNSYKCENGHTFNAQAHSPHDLPPEHCPECGNRKVALEQCKEALDSIWAAIGDALCSGRGIETLYANKVATECRVASDAAREALAAAAPAPPASWLPQIPDDLLTRYDEAVDKAHSVGALKQLKNAEAAIGRWAIDKAIKLEHGTPPPRDGQGAELCGVIGYPEQEKRVCELPVGHEDDYHRQGGVRWIGAFIPPTNFIAVTDAERKAYEKETAALGPPSEPASRSVQRRIALQKGETMPEFSGPPRGGSSSDLADSGNRSAAAFRCKAQRTADPPQDCDWPTCGCDPYADKVIAALQESGKL